MLVPWEQGNALFARVMELVDVPDSKSGGFGRAGSSPALGTIWLQLFLLLSENAVRRSRLLNGLITRRVSHKNFGICGWKSNR